MKRSAVPALARFSLVATLALLGGEGISQSSMETQNGRSAEDAARHYYEQLGYSIIGRRGVSVRIAETDLNNDGQKDALIHVESLDTCGTAGCDLLIVSSDSAGNWTVVNAVSGTWLPIGILPETSNGWQDIRVSIGPNVAQPHRRLRFDGRYSPELNVINLAPVVANTEGQILLR